MPTRQAWLIVITLWSFITRHGFRRTGRPLGSHCGVMVPEKELAGGRGEERGVYELGLGQRARIRQVSSIS
jgi:hypothetical protein